MCSFLSKSQLPSQVRITTHGRAAGSRSRNPFIFEHLLETMSRLQIFQPDKVALELSGEMNVQVNLAAAAAKLLQSCPTLCNPIDNSPPGSSVSGILQTRILEWVAISFSNACMHAKSLQSCQTLCDPMDSSPPGSSVLGILQTRILEWVAMPPSRGIFPKQGSN